MEAKISEERAYTDQATEDLLLKILEKEFRDAMQDVLEERRKITDPDICNIFNLWYLRNHVDGIRKELHDGFAGLRQEMEERFEKMEGRFEKMEGRFEKIEGRFEKIDDRFERMDQRISQIFIFLGVGFSIMAALITLFQFMA